MVETRQAEYPDTPGRGGYDYRFVETPSDMFVCKICHHPSREPFLSVCCGHTFCKSCLDAVESKTTPAVTYSTRLKKCPMCRNDPFTIFLNKQNERAIKGLHIFCVNKDKGCEWQGEVNGIDSHLQNDLGCLFEDVTCSNQCGKKLQRRNLLNHTQTCPRRTVDCQYCGVTGEYEFIEGEHKEMCPKFPLSCPNSCGVGEICREAIDGHRNTCPLEEVICSQECGIVLQRQHLLRHLETECPRREVKCQYCHIKDQYQLIEGDHKKECPKFPLSCPNNCGLGDIVREDVENHRNTCPLEEVSCNWECGIVLKRQSLASHTQTDCPRREVECQYCHIEGEHQFIEGEHTEECPKFPLPCPNACEVSSMPRETIELHREKCPLEMIQCEYNSVGCEAKMERRNQKAHEKDKMEDHLLLTKYKLDRVKSETMAELEEKFDARIEELEAQWVGRVGKSALIRRRLRELKRQ